MRIRAIVGLALTAGLAAAPAAGGTARPANAGPQQRVVVQASSVQAAAAAVRAAGGTVGRALPIVDGVAATLPAGAVLSGAVVTPDARVLPRSTDGPTAGPAYNVFSDEMQASSIGGRSRSVTVAIIDTGITSTVGGLADNLLAVPDPYDSTKTAPCANFSYEDGCQDSYGHGTFLAGLIAGDRPFPGIDPSAKLVSVKIAGRDGASDTSQLLAAIQYVVSFKDQLNIKVLNLSLGTDSNHDSRKDPLNRAVERAWQSGITVVVAGSNRGHEGSASTISKPADDPLVVTVGAVDDRGTGSRNDDVLPSFTPQGPVVQGPEGDRLVVPKPDVVAPGVGLISLVSPGSHIEQTAPPSSVPVSGYRRGSGTSQATALVSGAAALLLERRSWTPDEVKLALWRGARRVDGPWNQTGAGLVSVSGSLGQSVEGFRQPAPRQDELDQDLDLARGTTLVTSFSCSSIRQSLDGADCTTVRGGFTALGTQTGLTNTPHLVPFDQAGYFGQSWWGQSWYGSQWLQGQSWWGQSWWGQSWWGQSWYEAGPQETREGSTTDYGVVLPGSAWYGVWR